MLIVKTNKGLLNFFESKVVCPFCKTKIPIEDFKKSFESQNKLFIEYKCKCKYYFGITQNIEGDYIGFKF